MDVTVLGWGIMGGSGENGHGLSASIKKVEFVGQHNSYYLFKEDCYIYG
jgi:hypothetical protein